MKCVVAAGAVLLAAAAAAAGTRLDGVGPCREAEVGAKVVENLLGREYMLYQGGRGLHYAEACAAVGALRFAAGTGDGELLGRITARYEGFLDPEDRLISRVPHVDHNVEGIVPLEIFLRTGDRRYLEAGLTFADNQWEGAGQDGLTPQTRWWIDDMYMVGMLQIQAYRATGEARYADRAGRQLEAYLERLQQEDGLFFHGPEFRYCWGRGNGWVAASMAEVLRSLPGDHPRRPALLAGYRKMMGALLEHQSGNGMWRQLVDYEYAWAESSATAMMAYAMAVGVRLGWLEGAAYAGAVGKAWQALCAHVDRKGNVREICVGTGQVDDIEFYLNRPRALGDFHGQAPLLWLVGERLERPAEPVPGGK